MSAKRPRDVFESDDEEDEYDEYDDYKKTCKRRKVVALDSKSFWNEKRTLKRERVVALLSNRATRMIVDTALELAKPDFEVSSFGRTDRTMRGRHFQKTTHTGYSGGVKLEKGETVRVHLLVHVLNNDPGLEKFKPGDTVNHINHVRDDNDYKNHEWKSKPGQSLDRVFTAASKASSAAKQGLGRIRFVETDKDGTELGAWSGIYPSSHAVARETGNSHSKMGAWLSDGKGHKHKKTGKYFKYEQLPIEDDGVERELRCVPKGSPWLPEGSTNDGLMFSHDGLYRTGPNDDLKMGTQAGHYQKVVVGGEPVLINDVLGWTFHGPQPSPRHTVDHIDRKLDANGMLSNHKDNLRWASPEEQGKNKGSWSRSDGTPVLVTTIADGTTVKYESYGLAAAAAGVGYDTIKYRCERSNVVKGKRYEFAPQPDLVKARAKTSVVGGIVKLVLTTEKESWKSVYKEDWLEGGKYFKVRGEKQGPMAERHERREAKKQGPMAERHERLKAKLGPMAERHERLKAKQSKRSAAAGPSSADAGPASAAGKKRIRDDDDDDDDDE